tara:strand:- start:223 stop:858 length:636 start_codon:yes stop_codon:yes gene_type:complete
LPVNFQNLNEIKASLAHHPNSNLLVVSKNRNIDDIDAIYKSGSILFGENRVQEAQSKFQNYAHIDEIQLHLIGPLQTNKVTQALSLFNVIQTLDRKKLVEEIIKVKNKNRSIKTSEFYIQINIGNEEQKSGVPITELEDLYNYCLNSNIKIEGLMCIPPNNMNPEPFFDKMLSIRNSLSSSLSLSMGMSSDYREALKKESNLIRVGSKIFE